MTFVEECDFTDVDLKQLVPTVLRATAAGAAGVPRAERAARGRRDRLPRPLRPRRRRADRRRGSSCRSCAAATRAPRRARAPRSTRSPRGRAPGRSRPRSCAARRSRVTSAGKLGGLFVTPLVNHPEVGDPRRPPDRAARPSSRDGEIVVRPIGQHQRHVRPPRRRRRARRRVRARRDRRRSRAGGLDAASGLEVLLEQALRSSARSRARRSAPTRACARHEHERRHVCDAELARPSSGAPSTSTCITRRRSRSFRAMWATRLSIRATGPERAGGRRRAGAGRESPSRGISAVVCPRLRPR